VWCVRVCPQFGRYLPLHKAASANASERVIQALLDAYPQAAKMTHPERNDPGPPRFYAEKYKQTAAVIALLARYEQL